MSRVDDIKFLRVCISVNVEAPRYKNDTRARPCQKSTTHCWGPSIVRALFDSAARVFVDKNIIAHTATQILMYMWGKATLRVRGSHYL